MTSPGRELDAARRRVVERGLTVAAVGQLTEVVNGLTLEALGPVKQMLKRFFSERPWTEHDDDNLADAIGGGAGGARRELEPGLTLVWGWERSRFRLRVESDDPGSSPGDADATDGDLGQLFDGVVVPEATPSPRTVRFATPPLHDGPSRAFDSAGAGADPRVARIFGDFEEVTNVLVGPEFVAVTISHPDRWATVLGPLLRAVTEEFTGDAARARPGPEPPVMLSRRARSGERGVREPRSLERAWAELGTLRAGGPDRVDRVLAAARDREAARRQVAAALLADVPPEVAAREWDRMLEDPSRVVRRSVVDALAGAGREALRPLLERALDDDDAWTRWKALRGLAVLGVGASRTAVATCAQDADFRVRLEATRLLSDAPSS